jgi:hypothetical protein
MQSATKYHPPTDQLQKAAERRNSLALAVKRENTPTQKIVTRF